MGVASFHEVYAMKALAGDFPREEYKVLYDCFQFQGPARERAYFSDIEEVELLGEDEEKSSGLASAVVGGAIFGRAGAVLGALLGWSSRNVFIVAFLLVDGRHLTAKVTRAQLSRIQRAVEVAERTPAEARRRIARKRADKERKRMQRNRAWYLITCVVFFVIVVGVVVYWSVGPFDTGVQPGTEHSTHHHTAHLKR